MNSSVFSKKKIRHVAIIMDGNGRWSKKKKVAKKVGQITLGIVFQFVKNER